MNSRNCNTTNFAIVGICLSFFMVIFDTTVVNVAVTAIQSDLGAALGWLQWSVNAYTLAFASLLLWAGSLSDRFGPKRVFIAGLVVFVGASASCCLASCMPFLVFARVAQGAGAATLMPSSLSLITHTFPDSRERARRIGIWACMGGIAISSGPVLGGFLVDTFGWQSIFLINVPVGIVALALTVPYQTPTESIRKRALDPIGQALAIMALGALTYGIIEGPVRGWAAPTILAAFMLALTTSSCFIVLQKRGVLSMLPMELIRSRSFAAANVVGFCLNFGLYGLLFIISLFFQDVCEFSAFSTGLALLPLTAAIAMTLLQSNRIAEHLGSRSPIIIGMALATVGCIVLLSQGKWTGYSGITIIGFILVGLGIGITMPAMTAVVLACGPAELSGIAAGVLSASRQAGGAIGVALFGCVAAGPGLSSGVTLDLVIATVAFLLSCIVSIAWIEHKATFSIKASVPVSEIA